MGVISTFIALDLNEDAKRGQKWFDEAAAAHKVDKARVTKFNNRSNAESRLRSGRGNKSDAALHLTTYAERWEQAGRPDFAAAYRKMAFRIADGAPFTVAIDPVTQEIAISA